MALTTTFVGVDADAIGNGDDDETLPVDTWLQNRINLNNLNMLAPRVGYTWSPIIASAGTFTSYAGIRPYCAFEWFAVWRGFVWVHKGQTGIDVTLAYQADTPGNTTQAGTVQVEVRCDDGTSTRETLASTYSSGIKTGHQTIEVTFNEPVRNDGLMLIGIWSRSKSTTTVATTIGDSADGSSAAVLHKFPYMLEDTDGTGDGYFDPNSSGTSPDGDSLEAMYLYQGTHPLMPSAQGDTYDMIFAGDQSSTGTIAGTLSEVVQGAPSTASSMTAYMHVCLMLRAVHFEPKFPLVFQTDDAKGRYAPIQEFGAAEAMFQAQEAIRAYRQPTVALVGPRGRRADTAYTETDLDGFAANDYPVHWPTILGDYTDATQGTRTDLISEGFYMRTENPTLELVCQWVSIQHDAQYDENQNPKTQDGRTYRDKNGKLAVEDIGGPGRATWDLTASVHQLDDAASGAGDWATDVTEYGSLSQTGVAIPVYGARLLTAQPGTPPILRGMDSIKQNLKAGATAPGFWFKEGHLFEDDVPLLYETRHTIEVSGMAQAQTLLPFRLKVNMDFNEFTDPVKEGSLDPTGSLRLTLVSFTLIEHPQDP